MNAGRLRCTMPINQKVIKNTSSSSRAGTFSSLFLHGQRSHGELPITATRRALFGQQQS